MQYNLSFDYGSLAFLVVFFSYYFSMQRFPSRLNKIYEVMIVSVFVSVVFDILGCMVITYPQYSNAFLMYSANMIYMIVVNTLVRLLYVYTVLLTDEKKLPPKIVRRILDAPYYVSVFFILTTPFTGLVLNVDSDLNYTHGPMMVPIHLIALFYVTCCIIRMMKYSDEVTAYKRISVYFFLALLVFAIVVQAFTPSALILGFACSMGVFAVYLSQHNPHDTMDDVTHAFNRNSFLITVNDYIKYKKPFKVIAFAPDNFQNISDERGLQMSNLMLRRIAAFASELTNYEYVYKLDGYKFAILLDPTKDNLVSAEKRRQYSYALDVFSGSVQADTSDEERIVLQGIMERFDHDWNINDSTISLTACICCISYPSDVKRVEEILDMIDSSLIFAREIGTGTMLYAAEYTATRERRIDELMKKQIELERVSCEAEEAREQAENADRSKTRFLANMSHEIRTPMNAIMGMTELVLRDDINEQVRRNMGNIQSACNTLLTIINDILDFSKIEAGKMEVFPAPYYVASMLNNVVSVVSARMVGKKLDFIVDVDPTIPSQLIGDEMRLRQIMINILVNAVKYTENGNVTMKVNWVLKNADTDTDEDAYAELNIDVIDTGIGIKPEHLNKLFESFTRIEEKRNRLVEGTGLGLSICKRLVDLMDGKLSVKSVYGEGSTFSVTIPQKIENYKAFSYVMDNDTMKVLVYSENQSITDSLKRILEQLGVAVSFTDNDEMFIKRIEEEQFTHIFIEYTKYDLVADRLAPARNAKIILALKNRQLAATRSNTVVIQQPFYCLNVAEALNDVYTDDYKSEKPKLNTFYAPDARILVVDDNIVNLQVITGLMQPHKMTIDTAESGRECLKLVQKTEYNIIYMDHMMPDMDGIETLKHIREMDGDYYKNVPVVVITANAISGVKEMFEEAGFQSYVSKPVSIEKLEDTLLEFLPLELIKESTEVEEKENNGNVIAPIIPGVNVQKGIELCGGRLQNYINLLAVVLLDGRRKCSALADYAEGKDYKNYQIEAHALKSVAASIGATDLSAQAKEQEFAVKEERYDDIPTGSVNLVKKYDELLNNIQSMIDENPALSDDEMMEVSTELTKDVLRRKLLCILALLHDFEEDAAYNELKEILLYKMNSEYKQFLKELNGKLELYDYDEAEAQIKSKLEEIDN